MGQTFQKFESFNMGTRGDRTQHVLWWIKFGLLPANVNIVIIHAGTNNLGKNKPLEVAKGILQIGHAVRQTAKFKNCHYRFIAQGPENHRYRDDVNTVNDYLCNMLKPGESILYLKPSGWTLPQWRSQIRLLF